MKNKNKNVFMNSKKIILRKMKNMEKKGKRKKKLLKK